ncbi:MAG: DNA-deoxyinosine glycosylase [Eubacteriales bacterium]|nr:DNA-deoxyinosine glycosylase [Eubacteriales bacterium]
MIVNHPIEPLFNKHSRVLILGSFPSVKSREEMFFYGHKQNRFWKVVSAVFDEATPATVEEKRDFVLRNNLALWDVIASCEIVGSSDSSIKNVVANDLSVILSNANIEKIFVNGKTAYKYYNKYILNTIGVEAVCLPSTSPANAMWSLDKLIEHWQKIKLI